MRKGGPNENDIVVQVEAARREFRVLTDRETVEDREAA